MPYFEQLVYKYAINRTLMGDLEVVGDLEIGCLEGAYLEAGIILKNIFFHIFITQAFSIKMRALLLVL